VKVFASLLAALMFASCSIHAAEPEGVPSEAISLVPNQNQNGPSLLPTSNPTSSQSPKENSLHDPSAEIEVEEQSGDGSRLMIDEIEFSLERVWLVIRSKSGEIFHSELLTYGAKRASIRLQKPLMTGKYFVSLHSDDGDNEFNEAFEPIIRGEERELVREDFTYRRTP
jgi:hypothetical protein